MIIGLLIESLVFCDRKIDSIVKTIEEQRSMGAIRSFGIKRGETVKNIRKIRFLRAIRSFRSFSKNDESDLITVPLFQRYTVREQFDHGRPFLKIDNIDRSKDRIPNPGCGTFLNGAITI